MNFSNTSTDSCQVAVGLLREDFAGHGLPLTSLVIESSTLLLLAGFVLYFLCRRPKVYLSAANVSNPHLSPPRCLREKIPDLTCATPLRRLSLSPSRTENPSSATRRPPQPNTASRRSPRSTRTPFRPRLPSLHQDSTRTWPPCLRCARAAPSALCRARPLSAHGQAQAPLRAKAAASRRSRASFRSRVEQYVDSAEQLQTHAYTTQYLDRSITFVPHHLPKPECLRG